MNLLKYILRAHFICQYILNNAIKDILCVIKESRVLSNRAVFG